MAGQRNGTGRRAGAGKAAPKKQTIKTPGKKPISFKPGGLHASVGVPAGQKIPAAKMQAALAGDYGPKAAAQARFAKNVLTGPKTGTGTARKRRGASNGRKSS